MDTRIVTAIYVTFVIIEAVPNTDGTFVSRQNGACDFYPQIKCSSDCSSLMVCYNPASPPIALKCPSYQPYCANAKCGTINENCQIKLKDSTDTDSFVCSTDGIFPDHSNCTNWYVCEGLNATKMSCDAGSIFNSKTNLCVRGTPRIDHASKNICRKISCANKPNKYILFPANPAFYAYCSNSSILLYKCKDAENEIFDITANRCVFNCPSAGSFANPLNCTEYYKCDGLIKFKQTKLACAEGHYFDGMNCVIGTDCGDGSTTEESTTSTPSTTEESTMSTTDESDISTPTAIPFRKTAPINIVKDSIYYSSMLPFNSIWKHNGKYSYRLGKNF